MSSTVNEFNPGPYAQAVPGEEKGTALSRLVSALGRAQRYSENAIQVNVHECGKHLVKQTPELGENELTCSLAADDECYGDVSPLNQNRAWRQDR